MCDTTMENKETPIQKNSFAEKVVNFFKHGFFQLSKNMQNPSDPFVEEFSKSYLHANRLNADNHLYL